MKVLITGGSGMVGRYLKKIIPNAITPSSRELDLTNGEMVRSYFYDNKFDYVVHLAAYVGSLHDNIDNATAYFDENILMNTIVTKYSYESGVKNFLGMLSSCIYPDNINEFPIKETHLHNGAPHNDLMSYGYAKRSHAVQLDTYKKRFNVNYNYLIPCNLYGIVSEHHEGRSHFVNDLIFKIINAQKNNDDYITLFGDGTPLRQFMHASDLAEIIFKYISNNCCESFNVAPDINMSIEDFALTAIKVCHNGKMSIKYDDSKPNGQYRKDVDTTLFNQQIKNFEFKSIMEGIKEVYEYYKKR
mgnify:FL=1